MDYPAAEQISAMADGEQKSVEGKKSPPSSGNYANGGAAGNNSSKKGVRRVRKRSSTNTSAFFFPTTVVCHPSEAATQPGAVECGVVISTIILVVYFIGFYQSLMSLPEVPGPPVWRLHMGENFNLPNTHWHDGSNGSSSSSSRMRGSGTSKQGGAASSNNNNNNNAVAPADEVDIPNAIWPVSVRDEVNDYETIIHTGDLKTEMKVPKFWSYPVHNGGLMSRQTALKIGSCTTPDLNNPNTGGGSSYQRGDACPHDQRTIYVGIASYRDFQCRLTVESIFNRAHNPDRIRVGVVDQIVVGEDVGCNEPVEPCDTNPDQALCKYRDQVDVYTMEAELSIGPVFARHIGYRLYRGEYYATQSDAHVSYTQDWDTDIISQLEATQNEMAVLSTYLTDVVGSISPDGHSLRHTRPIMCMTDFEGGPQGLHLRHLSQPERDPGVHGVPQLQPWWAAGYSFSRGHFITNVPYDPISPMIFQGEEMSIGIRGFSIGYDFYAPERSVCFHHYANGKNAQVRNKVPHFWEHSNKFAGTGKPAMARLLGIVHMNPEVDPSTWDHTEESIYGLGGVRTPEKFYETFGIDVVNKKVEHNLCQFVDVIGRMHHKFTPFLRNDGDYRGMGIDYSQITYQFKDPLAKQEEEAEKGEDDKDDGSD